MAVHGAFARVVAGGGQGEVAVEALQQPGQVLRTTADVLAGVVAVGHPEPAGRGRHQLHQPLGARMRQRHRVVGGLGVHDGAQDRLLHAELARGRGDLGLVGGGVQTQPAEVHARVATGEAGFDVAVLDGAQAGDLGAAARARAGVVPHAVLDVGIDLPADDAAGTGGGNRDRGNGGGGYNRY